MVAIGGVLLPTQAGNGSLPVPFPDADRSDDDKWVHIGVSIGTNDLARNEMNDPDAEWRAVIGEIEGEIEVGTDDVREYLIPSRIRHVASECYAVLLPDLRSAVEQLVGRKEDRDGVYQAINLGWLWSVIALEARILDIGNVAERAIRGETYKSERFMIQQQGADGRRWAFDVQDTFDHNVYRPNGAQPLKHQSAPQLPCD